MRALVVGDVHCVATEIQDCEALLCLVKETVNKHGIEHVLFLGDNHHCHNVLDSRVVSFWTNAINYFVKYNCRVTFLIGNHDFMSPTIMQPHSMVAHKNMPGVDIVDSPVRLSGTSFCAMPYYYNPVDFVDEAVKLKEANPDVETLFCHQTFCGATDGLGFYSKDSVEPSSVPFGKVVVGHLHKPMRLGKVWYVGSSRYRTLTDAEVETRHIYVLEDGKEPIAVPTNSHCVKIFRFEDSEKEPLSINLTPEELALADLRITVTGTSDYISHRMTELKAKYNAKCRGVPNTFSYVINIICKTTINMLKP